MANTSIEVEVKVTPEVDLKTAKTCLKIVELFLNSHFPFQLEQRTAKTGETELEIVCCCSSESPKTEESK